MTVSSTWFLVAALITVGFAPVVDDRVPGLGAGAYAVSLAFAVLLYGSVFLHELSHAVVARWFGLPVEGITLHFLGGYTEIRRQAPRPGIDMAVSAAGPALSLLVAGVAWAATASVQPAVPAFLLLELAVANLLVGAFNLLPALPLDGGHVLRAVVWAITGREGTGTLVAAWAGRVLAGLVLLAPFVLAQGRPGLVAMVWAGLVAAFIWTGAQQAQHVARLQERVPALSVAAMVRQALPVAGEVSVAEALRRAYQAGARGLVVVDAADRPVALVSEAAVSAVPTERRPWVAVGTVARRVDAGLVVGDDLTGEQLVEVMRSHPASEYLVVRPDGGVRGVLAASDVEAALARR